MQRLPRLTYVGVGLVAASVILLQIALTRVFAIMLWHHLTYMVVSIALLGFGASGSILTLQRRQGQAPPFGALAGYSLVYGLSVIAAFAAMRFVHIDSLKLWEDKSNLLALLGLYSITAVPFLFAGMCLGTALTCFVRHVNKLYFVDLLGSGAGGAASVLLLREFGGGTTIILAATLGLGGSFLFAFAASARHRLVSTVGLLGGAGACVLFTGVGTRIGLPHVQWHPPFAAGKAFAGRDPSVFDRIFSATAEVEVSPEEQSFPLLGGDVGLSAQRPIPVRGVGQDGCAPTLLIKGGGDLDKMSFVKNVQPASALVAHAGRGGVAPDVLVIGVGGGMDVMVALASGAGSVTAAEINTAMVEMVTDRYDDYIDGLFRSDAPHAARLQLVNAEGRSFVRNGDKKFDIIQMSGVDSFTALSTGAYTLSETYLYTTDAVREFYAHLEDGGYINYSRFLLAYPSKPRETLRLTNIACTALEELGIENPQSHIVVFQGMGWASTMIKRGPFVRAEIDALEKFAEEQGFLGLLFDPLRPPGEVPKSAVAYLDITASLPQILEGQLRQLLPALPAARRDAVRSALARGYAAMVAGEFAAVETIGEAVVGGFPAAERVAAKAAVVEIFKELYASSVAVAKNFTETGKVFHGLLSGSAAERQAFVDAYPYDISACTDDRPFFFNYYRYGQLLSALADPQSSSTEMGSFTASVPVGHVVLFTSMVQITLLALVLIFVPLRWLRSTGVRPDGTWRYFTFFAALGMGFMFVEIVLMQKMVIFLGHPIYAVSVVLSSLLCFAGVGSLLAGRMQSLSRRGFSLLGATIVTLVILVSVVMNSVMPAFLGYSLGWRIVAVTLLIAPIGMALGVPFPTGMRVVEANCPQLLPWCWAINGFLSVFSSVFCIVASMVVGFTVVLLAVAVIYAVGFMALLPLIAASTSRNSCSPPRRSSPAPPPVTWRSPSA